MSAASSIASRKIFIAGGWAGACSLHTRERTALHRENRGNMTRPLLKTIAGWSNSNAPRPISAGDALNALETDWTFAEDGLAEIFRRLGLPDLDRTFAALSTPTAEAGVVVSLPVHKLASLAASSLLQRLDRFSRSQAIAYSRDARSLEI